jgi:DNA-binding XRE family transcriptional regulator
VYGLRVAKNLTGRTFQAEELAALARELRRASGKSQKEVAGELGVSAPAVSNAESKPERSLFELRKRIIEKYSNYKLVGPEYRLVGKTT